MGGCGCKKKNNETQQPIESQVVTVTTDQTQQPVQTEQQDQVIQVAATLREMIENKEL